MSRSQSFKRSSVSSPDSSLRVKRSRSSERAKVCAVPYTTPNPLLMASAAMARERCVLPRPVAPVKKQISTIFFEIVCIAAAISCKIFRICSRSERSPFTETSE